VVYLLADLAEMQFVRLVTVNDATMLTYRISEPNRGRPSGGIAWSHLCGLGGDRSDVKLRFEMS
jgi:hypothetical protein